jgi:hypothetical protein
MLAEQTQSASDVDAAATIASAPAIRTRRNPKWIALGVIAVCLGAIASFVLYSQVSESQQVVAVRSSIDRGTTITAADLGIVRVGDTGGVATVPADEMRSMIGQVAAVDLIRGSLLPPDAVTSELPPARGKGVIGIRVSSGRAPVGFLAPGSPIRLVVLPASASGAEGGPAPSGSETGESTSGSSGKESTNVATISATVVNSTQLDDAVLINIELESGQAVDAASYAAQERVVVIRESER